MRQVWRQTKPGNLAGLTIQREELPEPQPHEVQVSVHSVGLNFADVFACLGLYSATPEGNFVPGLEFAGEISQTGSSNHGFKEGDRVMGVTRFGAYADRLNVDADYVYPLPYNWSYNQGAAFIVQSLTAYYGLVSLGDLPKLAQLNPDPVVLLHSAAGGVGLQALQILTKYGAHAVATIGSENKIPLLQERGLKPEQIIVRRAKSFGEDLDKALQYLNKSGFDIIMDSVSGPYFLPGVSRLLPGGRDIVFGSADFMPKGQSPNRLSLLKRYFQRPRVDPLTMVSRNQGVFGFNLIWLWDQVDKMRREMDGLMALELEPPYVGHTYPFAKAQSALRDFQGGHTVGKVVLQLE